MPTVSERAQQLGQQGGEAIRSAGNTVASRVQSLRAPEQPQEEIGIGETIGRFGLARLLDNFLGIPEDMANIQKQGIQSLAQEGRSGMATFPGASFIRGLQQRIQAGPLPEEQRIDLPLPESQDVFAGAQLAGETAGAVRTGDFSQFTGFGGAVEQQQARQQMAAEQNPLASQIGTASGDVATLLTGRPRLATAQRNARLRGAGQVRRGTAAPSRISQQVKSTVDDVWRSGSIKSLRRAAGKAAETGIEGAVISILNEGDVQETAAVGAGSSLAGSLALHTFPPSKRGLVNLAGTAAGLWALNRLAQDFGPGENDVFEAVDFAFQKIQYALIAGMLGAAAGAGRVGTGPEATQIGRALARNLPDVADAITAVPRGAALSFFNEYRKASGQDRQQIDSVMQTMAQSPDRIPPDARKRLDRAMKKGDQSITDTVNSLMRSKRFRDAINADLEGVSDRQPRQQRRQP